MRASEIDDEEIALWVNNDEGLYDWWRDSTPEWRDIDNDDEDAEEESLQQFIRENRAELTAIIRRALDQEPES